MLTADRTPRPRLGLGRSLFATGCLGAMLATMLAFAPGAHAAAGPTPCATWKVVSSAQKQYTIRTHVYTLNVYLYANVLSPSDPTNYCGSMYAKASLTIPLAGQPAILRADLHYSYGDPVMGPQRTGAAGFTVTTQTSVVPDVVCGDAVGVAYFYEEGGTSWRPFGDGLLVHTLVKGRQGRIA